MKPDPTYAPIESTTSNQGMKIAALLEVHAHTVSHDVSERLRISRQQALERAVLARRAQSIVAPTGLFFLRSLSFSSAGFSNADETRNRWWWRGLSLIPVVGLGVGLLVMQHSFNETEIATIADVDTAILADQLPPAAYQDPGFVEFIRVPGP
jgi:hypothetical protein